MIFLQYHDYSDYLLEYRTIDDVPRFSYLENPSKKIVIIPRVGNFTVHTNVVHYQKMSTKIIKYAVLLILKKNIMKFIIEEQDYFKKPTHIPKINKFLLFKSSDTKMCCSNSKAIKTTMFIDTTLDSNINIDLSRICCYFAWYRVKQQS